MSNFVLNRCSILFYQRAFRSPFGILRLPLLGSFFHFVLSAVHAVRIPIHPPSVFPNTSSNSAIPSPVIYWVVSIAIENRSGIRSTHFFLMFRYSPVPSGMNNQILLITPTLTLCFAKNLSA